MRFERNRPQPKPSIWKRIRGGLAKLVGARLKEDIFGGANLLVEPDDPEGRLFRELGRRGARRTIPSHLMQESSRQAFKLLIENPYVKRIANIRADFIVGSGITAKSENQQVLDAIMQFWTDKANDLVNRQHQYALEFGLYGELVMERMLNVETGRTRLNPRDPLEIGRVEGHPLFDLIPWRMFFHIQGGEIAANILNTLPLDLVKLVPGAANILYFRANQTTGNLRGVSDYYDMLEWADSLDSAAWSMLERMNQLITYIWHMTVKNLKAEDKPVFKSFLENARPSSGLVTEEGVTLDPKTPDLKSADYAGGADWVKAQLAMSGGIQPNWIGLPGANVGESASMDTPVFRTMARKQGEFLRVIETLTDDNLMQRVRHGTLPAIDQKTQKAPWNNYSLDVDPVSRRELGQIANVAVALSSAITNALNEGQVTKEEGATLIRSVLSEIRELKEELPEEITRQIDLGISDDELQNFGRLAGLTQVRPNGTEGPGSRIDARIASGS